MNVTEKRALQDRAKMPIKEIKLVGRSFLFEIEIGYKTRVVEITAAQFAEMVGMLDDTDLPARLLEQMAKLCRANFTKGKIARRLRESTIETIKQGMATFFGRSWESIVAIDRHIDYIETRRHVYGYLKGTNYTEAEIHAHFVQRDRKTIYSGIDMHNNLMETDGQYRRRHEALCKHMEGFMLGGEPRPSHYPGLDRPAGVVEELGDIHTSTDRIRIDRESTEAANAIGAAMEGW